MRRLRKLIRQRDLVVYLRRTELEDLIAEVDRLTKELREERERHGEGETSEHVIGDRKK